MLGPEDAMAEGPSRRRGPRLALVSLALAVSVVVAILALAPAVARRLIEQRASALFPGVVTIGALDVGWWDARIAAEDVDVWAIDAPAAPLLRVKRVSLQLDLAALRRRVVHLRELELEQPELHVERLADGRFSVRDLEPEAGPAASAEPGAASAEPGAASAEPGADAWRFHLDALRLVGGRVHFRDLRVEGSDELPIEIESVVLDRVSLREGPLPEPATLRLEARVGGAPLRLEVVATSLLPRLAFEASLAVTGMPLEGVALLGEAAGVESLRGRLDATLHHAYATDAMSALDGTLTLHDVSVGSAAPTPTPAPPPASGSPPAAAPAPTTAPTAATGPAEAGSPPLGWKRLDAEIESLDVRARTARLGRVTIAGASVVVTPGRERLLPAFAPPAPVAPALPPDVTAPVLAPYAWSIARLELADARLRIRAERAKPLDVTATLQADGVDGTLAKPFPLTVEAKAASGTATLRGDAQLAPPGFRGTLKLAGLDLARLLESAGPDVAHRAALVRGAKARADLRLELPPDDPAEPAAPDWIVRGSLSLAALARPPEPTTAARNEPASLAVGWDDATLMLGELRVASPLASPGRRTDPTWRGDATLSIAGADGVIPPRPGEPGLVLRWHALDLALRELRLPDLLDLRAGGAWSGRGQIAVAGLAFADYALDRESELGVAWERLEGGIDELRLVTPEAGTSAGAGTAAPQLERLAVSDLRVASPWLRLTRTRTGFSMPAALQGGSGGRAPAELSAAPVALAEGSVRFVDQTVSPYYDVDFTALRLDARLLRSRGPTLDGVVLTTRSARDARIRIEGGGDAGGLTFVARADDVPLPPFNPYASALGYDVRAGEAGLVSSLWIGTAGIEAKNWLTLRRLEMRELVEGSFEKITGVSLSLALDVLTDGDGKIELTLPVWWNAEGFGLEANETLRAATRQAIVGTLLLPLRKLGAAVGGKKDAPRIEPPAPIPFAAGSAELSAEGETRVLELARFLASHPGVAVVLEAYASAADGGDAPARRGLAERRVARVADRLRVVHGVPAQRIRASTLEGGSEGAAAEVRIRLDAARGRRGAAAPRNPAGGTLGRDEVGREKGERGTLGREKVGRRRGRARPERRDPEPIARGRGERSLVAGRFVLAP